MIRIDCINASTVLTDEQLTPIFKAIQKQISNDFAELGAGGRDAQLNQILKGQKPGAENWWLTVLDNSDQADALGYHDLTPLGQPIGKVFAKSDLDCGSSVSVTISHETLEMIGDPQINRLAMNADSSRVYAFENCDAVESDDLGYKIDDILLSDFVTDAFFEDPPPSVPLQYDFRKKIGRPFQILPGGYLSYLDFTNLAQGWQESTARLHTMAGRKPPGSRVERRKVLSTKWIRSTAFANELGISVQNK